MLRFEFLTICFVSPINHFELILNAHISPKIDNDQYNYQINKILQRSINEYFPHLL